MSGAKKDKPPSSTPALRTAPSTSTDSTTNLDTTAMFQQMMQHMSRQQELLTQQLQQQQAQQQRELMEQQAQRQQQNEFLAQQQALLNRLLENQVAAARTAPVVVQPPKKFNGDENPEEVPFQRWAESLRIYAEKSTLDPVALLHEHLGGKAKMEFLSIPAQAHANFEDVIDILKDRLQPTKSAVHYAMDLSRIEQGKSESVVDYEVRFRQTLNKIDEEHRVDHLVNGNFLLGLKPVIREKIFSKVTEAHMETKDLIKKAIQVERDFEAVRNFDSSDARSKFYHSKKPSIQNEKPRNGSSETRPISRNSFFCSHCKMSNHGDERCFKLHPELRKFSKRREISKNREAKQNFIRSNPSEKVKINGVEPNAVLDTAAELSMISKTTAKEVSGVHKEPKRVLVGANGKQIEVDSVVKCEVELAGEKHDCDLYVEKKWSGFGSDALLGWNDLQQFGVELIGRSGARLGANLHSSDKSTDIPSLVDEDIFNLFPDDCSWLHTDRNQDAQILMNEVVEKLDCSRIDPKDLGNTALEFDSSLTAAQKAELTRLIESSKPLFASSFSDLKGGASGIEHSISLVPGTKPIKQKPRFFGPLERKVEKEEVEKILANGIIRESHSAWASPVVLVKKADGSTRFCIDFRKLNSVTEKDAHPLPNISQMWGNLGGSAFFSSLDLFSGYWQIPMAAESMELTAFATSTGFYEFVVMPFGLTNAPATFQRFMTEVIGDLKDEQGNEFCQVYLDDILVYSKTFEEHIHHLALLFEKLQKRNLFLKFKKCDFAQRELTYLGIKVTPEGIFPDPDKVSAVQQFPPPSNVSTLRSFLGFTSYFRQFIPGYATIVVPLFSLLRKGAKWRWSEAEDGAFEKIKFTLVKATLLHFPKFFDGAEFLLETDASNVGIGCALSQVFEGNSVPLYFFSRCLRKPEKNYSTINQEMLAIIWGLKKASKIVPIDSITVLTDHKPLLAAMNSWKSDAPNSRIERWMQFLAGKNIQIKFQKGSQNQAADFLSCINVLRILPRLQNVQPQILLAAQISDSELLEYESSNPDEVVVIDGIWYKKENESFLLMVPQNYRENLIKEEHELGHFSGDRTYDAMKRKFWWPTMRTDTLSFVAKCLPCNERNPTKPERNPYPGTVIGKFPMEIIAADVLQLPTSHAGNRYVLVAIDSFTRFPFVFPMPDQSGKRIADLLSTHVFSVFGAPVNLLTDRGTNLCGRAMECMLSHYGIKHLKTTPAYPEGNGQAERFCRTLVDMLAKKCYDYRHWDRELVDALTAYRNQPNKMTRKTPHEMIFNHNTKMEESKETNDPTTDETANNSKFKVGDMVMWYDRVRKQGPGWKLERCWRGPYKIMKLKLHVAEIKDLNTKKEVVVNRSKLKHHGSKSVDPAIFNS